MNASDEISIVAETVSENQATASVNVGHLVDWDTELGRRARRLQQLLDLERAEPRVAEPWRMKLIHRALFSTWLDSRAA